jgi:hypothetical protein
MERTLKSNTSRALRVLLTLATAIVASQAVSSADAKLHQPVPPVNEYASSLEEYNALQLAARGGTRLQWAKMPDWSGVWQRETSLPMRIYFFDESAEIVPGTRGYPKPPALTPRYQAAYEKKMEGIKSGKEWDRLSWCLPAGYPRVLAEPWLREFVVTPNETWMTHEQVNETRRVYTDGRGHVPDAEAIPLWLGDSIGFWNRDTLVVHTTHVKAGQYQRGNPDYSFKTTTVEQLRLVEPTMIEDRVTVYDPDSLLKPMHAVFHYRKRTGDVRVNYASCEENNNTYLQADGSPNERLPGDPGYRDASTYGIPEVAYDSIPQ